MYIDGGTISIIFDVEVRSMSCAFDLGHLLFMTVDSLLHISLY